MSKPLIDHPISQIYSLLPNSIKSIYKNDDFVEFDYNNLSSDSRKRVFYLHQNGNPLIHVSYGEGLEQSFHNTQRAWQINQDLFCKPLFLCGSTKYKLFGQEYFSGQPIDRAFKNKLIEEQDVKEIISNIKENFSNLEINSSIECMHHELKNIFDEILSNRFLEPIDLKILEELLFPLLQDKLNKNECSSRWSPGDLAARNILVGPGKRFKIIDLEFAHETHFHFEDWIRLKEFSEKPFSDLYFIKSLNYEDNPYYYLYHYIRQIIITINVCDDKKYSDYIKYELSKIILKVSQINSLSSSILTGLTNSTISIQNIYSDLVIKSKYNEDILQNINEFYKSFIEEDNDSKTELYFTKIKLKKLSDKIRSIISERDVLANQVEDLKKNSLNISHANNILYQAKNDLEIDVRRYFDKIKRLESSFSWNLTKPIRFLRRMITSPFTVSLQSKKESNIGNNTYEKWIENYDLNSIHAKNRNEQIKSLNVNPKFSIIMPVYNTASSFLEQAIDSVLNQFYVNWELCINDDNSSHNNVRKVLSKYKNKDSRIKINFSIKNEHISLSSNRALALADGDFIVFFDHDDLLRPHTLLDLASSISKNHKAKVIYTDEDKICERNVRSSPYFKPDWNSDLLLSQNYLCHLFCVEADLVKSVGGFRQGFEGSQDWDLALRVVEKVDSASIIHIPKILYHWRIHSNSVANDISNKSYAVQSGKKAVEECLKRKSSKATVEIVQKQFMRVNRVPELESYQKSTIIIPTKNNYKLLRDCINSINEHTLPDSFEILIIDNQTDDPRSIEYYDELKHVVNIDVVSYDAPFNFSSINNYASKLATAGILVFLNDDTTIKTKDWLQELMSEAQRPDIGAVGAKLLYPNNIYQHAGIVLGYCLVAGEIMKGLPHNHPGQMQRANLKHNVSAVTGACLAIEKKKFVEVGGFDEVNLKVAFNDVDLCLRLSQLGYRTLYNPDVVLHHFESFSRGLDDTPEKKLRFESEINYMLAKWSEVLDKDPNYNPNLSLEWEKQFQLAFPPRK
jgi:GT2 family glycosyltransferase